MAKAINIKVYSTSACPWCIKAKEFLKAHNLKYEDLNISNDENARSEMFKKSGQFGVPVIDVNRWDYYYSFVSGDKKVVEQKALSLYFVDNKLKHFDGDWVPAHLPRKSK